MSKPSIQAQIFTVAAGLVAANKAEFACNAIKNAAKDLGPEATNQALDAKLFLAELFQPEDEPFVWWKNRDPFEEEYTDEEFREARIVALLLAAIITEEEGA